MTDKDKGSFRPSASVPSEIVQGAMPQWRPIETCPRGHDQFLIGWATDGAVLIGEWNSTWRCVDWVGSLMPHTDQPTHWMPLPSPPEQP